MIERAGSSPLSPSSANALFANANTVRAFHTAFLQAAPLTFLPVQSGRSSWMRAVLGVLWLQVGLQWLVACSGPCVRERASRA